MIALLALSGFLIARSSHSADDTIGLLAIDMDNTGNTIGAALDLCGPGQSGGGCTEGDTTPNTESALSSVAAVNIR